jgi:hypothetical protein
LKAFTVGLEARQLSSKSGQEEEEACFTRVKKRPTSQAIEPLTLENIYSIRDPLHVSKEAY